MKVKKELLTEELDLPSSAIENLILEMSRWSVRHKIVFEMNGKFYEAYYSTGATEYQDEGPWEYQKEVEITEVHKVSKTIEVWEPVNVI